MGRIISIHITALAGCGYTFDAAAATTEISRGQSTARARIHPSGGNAFYDHLDRHDIYAGQCVRARFSRTATRHLPCGRRQWATEVHRHRLPSTIGGVVRRWRSDFKRRVGDFV